MIGNIAMTLLNMGYKSRDINVVVGHKSEQIVDYLGTDMSFYNQLISSRVNPASDSLKST